MNSVSVLSSAKANHNPNIALYWLTTNHQRPQTTALRNRLSVSHNHVIIFSYHIYTLHCRSSTQHLTRAHQAALWVLNAAGQHSLSIDITLTLLTLLLLILLLLLRRTWNLELLVLW